MLGVLAGWSPFPIFCTRTGQSWGTGEKRTGGGRGLPAKLLLQGLFIRNLHDCLWFRSGWVQWALRILKLQLCNPCYGYSPPTGRTLERSTWAHVLKLDKCLCVLHRAFPWFLKAVLLSLSKTECFIKEFWPWNVDLGNMRYFPLTPFCKFFQY